MMNLLHRSDAFEEALAGVLNGQNFGLFSNALRHTASAAACILSNEHGKAVRSCFAIDTPNSGTALMRLQFEALLRGAWTLYAASDLELSKLGLPLDGEGERAAGNLPGGSPMLEALARKAPPGLVQPLQQFQEVSRKTLNSYVHSGIHPLNRVASGFPEQLSEQIIRNSNGLMHMSYRLLATLSGSQDLVNQTTRLHVIFSDCLPKS